MVKTLTVEGTVFWLAVSAIMIAGSSIGSDAPLLASSLITAVVYLIIAYICWSRRRWGFIAAIILALITTLGGIAFPFFEAVPITSGFQVLSAGGFLFIPQLLLIFYGLRAYRERETS